VANEEDGCVVANQIVVAFFGVELHGPAARVAHGIRGALLAGHGREANRHRGPLADGIQEGGFGPLADGLGDLEVAEGAAALGVHDALGHALAIERLHLLDHVVILEQDWTVRAYGERVVVACRGDAGVGGGGGNRLIVWIAILAVQAHVFALLFTRVVRYVKHGSGAWSAACCTRLNPGQTLGPSLSSPGVGYLRGGAILTAPDGVAESDGTVDLDQRPGPLPITRPMAAAHARSRLAVRAYVGSECSRRAGAGVVRAG